MEFDWDQLGDGESTATSECEFEWEQEKEIILQPMRGDALWYTG